MFGPSVMALCFKSKSRKSSSEVKQGSEPTKYSLNPCLNTLFDCIAVICQVSLVAIFIFFGVKNTKIDVIWSIPLSIFLTSFRYWENYLGENTRFKCMNGLYDCLKNLSVQARVWKVDNQLIASVWKIIVTLFLMPFLVVHRTESGYNPNWTFIFRFSQR